MSHPKTPPKLSFFVSLQKTISYTISLILFVSLAPCFGQGPTAAPGNLETLRIVLVGDSITGLSRNYSGGFAHIMEKALQATHPDREIEIAALGGSGQSVSSWFSIAERSKTNETILDVKGVDAHVELAQPADVLVVMLGMNDVLAPYVGDSEGSLDNWIAKYEKLVEGLRERTQPKVLALAGVTPYTEDPLSPVNQLIDRMNQRIRLLAEKMQGRYIETSEKSIEVLRKGRSFDPEFHVTRGDYVHPGEAGHLAIAEAMLAGMGAAPAAQWVVTEKLDPLWAVLEAKSAGISWEHISAVREPNSQNFVFHFRYATSGKVADSKASVQVVPPTGWQAIPATLPGPSGEFRLIGNPDRKSNGFVLRSGQTEVQGMIPAPWLVTAGVKSKWDGSDFDAEKNHTEIEDLIIENKDVTLEENVQGEMAWVPTFSSINYTGGTDPNSVDFAAVTHPYNFEAGYGVRWVFSEKERPINVDLKSSVFAGTIHLLVWVNGEKVYQGMIRKEPRGATSVPANLKKGWNALVFKASHRTFLWQVSVGLSANEGDSLDDLRYKIPLSNPQ